MRLSPLRSGSNAVSEAFNSEIQALKAAARGFRNAANYRIRILFFCGKLDFSHSRFSTNHRLLNHQIPRSPDLLFQEFVFLLQFQDLLLAGGERSGQFSFTWGHA